MPARKRSAQRDESRFVDGIFNYCDRWCERCEYTDRCRLFADLAESDDQCRQAGQDPSSPESAVQQVADSFGEIHRMLREQLGQEEYERLAAQVEAEAQARDENPPPPTELDATFLPDSLQKVPPDGDAWTQARWFFRRGGEMLHRLEPLFNEARRDAEQRGQFMNVAEEADTLQAVLDAAEVLSWDHTLVSAKVRRALRGLDGIEEEDSPEFREVAREDAAGSASVARRCLIRSAQALRLLYEWDDSLQDLALDLLATAERLRKQLEDLLPECVDFPWPPKEALSPPKPSKKRRSR